MRGAQYGPDDAAKLLVLLRSAPLDLIRASFVTPPWECHLRWVARPRISAGKLEGA